MRRLPVISTFILIAAGTALVAHVERTRHQGSVAVQQLVESAMRRQRDAINQSILANHYYFQSGIPLTASLRVDAVEYMRHEDISQFPEVFSVGELVSESTIASAYPRLRHAIPWLRKQEQLAGDSMQQTYLFHTNIWQLTGMVGFENALCADILLISTVDDRVADYWFISQVEY